jgi:hypothetical protein
MNPEFEEQLRALANRYTERRSNLSKDEIAEATALCTRVLAGGREGLDLCWRFAGYLPADALAEAIATTWPILDESLQRSIIARQKRLPEAAAARLQLRSAVALCQVDAAIARQLLSSACYTMMNRPNNRPSKEQLKIFRSVLLSGEEPALARFAFDTPTQAEIGMLLASLSEVLFARRADRQRAFSPNEPRVIEWLLQNSLFVRLTEAQLAGAVALVKSWPREAKAAFGSKYEQLPVDLDQALRIDESSSSEVEPKDSMPPLSGPEPKVEPPPNGGVRELLDQLSLAIAALEADNKSAREELQEKESIAQTLKVKLSNTESELRRAEGELIESRAKLQEQVSERQAAQREAANLWSELEALDLKLSSEKEEHFNDSRSLLARIEVEKDRAAQAVANRLAEKLRLEWRDFESVNNSPMDCEVGESLRHLLRGIFDMLQREGIKIRE